MVRKNQKPQVPMSQPLLFAGVLCIALGFLLVFLWASSQSSPTTSPSSDGSKVSFVGFIGPIPFGFGNDTKLLTWSVIIGFLSLFMLWTVLRRGV